MAEGNTDIGNRGLVATLGVLGVMVVGLIIAIVVVNVNRNSQVVVEAPEESGESTADGGKTYLSTLSDEEWDEVYRFRDDLEEVRTRAQELLDANPADIDGAMSLYEQPISKFTEEKDYTKVQSYMLAENEDLLARGLEREALVAMSRVDFSIFPTPAQYRYYVRILELANKLGDTEMISKYEPLAASTKAAADRADAIIQASLPENNAGVIPQGDKE